MIPEFLALFHAGLTQRAELQEIQVEPEGAFETIPCDLTCRSEIDRLCRHSLGKDPCAGRAVLQGPLARTVTAVEMEGSRLPKPGDAEVAVARPSERLRTKGL